MKTRVKSGILMLPFLLIIYFGGLPLTIATAIIGFIGIQEFFRGWENIEVKPSKTVANVMIAILYAIHLISISVLDLTNSIYSRFFFCNLLMLWIAMSIALSLVYGWKIDKRSAYDAVVTIIGIIYIGFFSYHLVLLDTLDKGYIFTWTVLISSFGSDIFAYFTGYLIGKHKLAPILSPKKTIEGSIGGVAGAAILCGLYGFIFAKEYLVACVIIGILGGIVSQAGDLTASAFKRKMGIKDYGNLIPGHGGIMDRFDSVIFTSPFVYYFVNFFVN